MARYLLVLCWLCWSIQVTSATIDTIEVRQNESRYSMVAIVVLEADSKAILDVIMNYSGLVEVNPYLQKNNVLSDTGAATQRVSMLTRVCVMVVRYKLRHVQDFTHVDANTV